MLSAAVTHDPATAEPSRETNIPRLGVVEVEVTPGAGGTISNNLAALGAGRVAVLGVVGDDGFGFELGRSLEQRGVDSGLLVKTNRMRTFGCSSQTRSDSARRCRPA